MSLQSLLSGDTVVFRRSTIAKDSSGGSTRTFADLFSGVPARVEDLSASAAHRYLQLGMRVSHMVTCQQDGGRVGDLILTSDGRTLQVEDVDRIRGMGGIPTYFEYSCLENRQGA